MYRTALIFTFMFIWSFVLQVRSEEDCHEDSLPATICESLRSSCDLNTDKGDIARDGCAKSCGICKKVENLEDLQTPKNNQSYIYQVGIVSPCLFHEKGTTPLGGFRYWDKVTGAGSTGLRVGGGNVVFEYVSLETCTDEPNSDSVPEIFCRRWRENVQTLLFVNKVNAMIHLRLCPPVEEIVFEMYNQAQVLVVSNAPTFEAAASNKYRFAIERESDQFFEVLKEAELNEIIQVGVAFADRQLYMITAAKLREDHFLDAQNIGRLKYYEMYPVVPVLVNEVDTYPQIDRVLLDMQAAGVKLGIFLSFNEKSVILQRMSDLNITFDAVNFFKAEFQPLVDSVGRVADFVLSYTKWTAALDAPCPVFGSNFEFVSGFEAFTGAKPAEWEAYGAVYFSLFQHAMQYHGSFFVEKMVEALEEMTVDSILGRLKFSEDHVNIGRESVILQIQNAKVEIVKPKALASADLVLPNPSWDCRTHVLMDNDTEVCGDMESTLWRGCVESYLYVKRMYDSSACAERESYEASLVIRPVADQNQESSSASISIVLIIVFAGIGLCLLVLVVMGLRMYAKSRKLLTYRTPTFTIKEEDLVPLKDSNGEVVVCGMGAFGVVFVALYRGTKVAVKSVIPADVKGEVQEDAPQDQVEKTFGSILMKTSTDPHTSTSANSKFSDASQKQLLRSRGPAPEKADLVAEFQKETSLLMQIRHPHVVTVLGAYMDAQLGCCMVMEFMECGSLYEALHNHSAPMEMSTIVRLLTEVACGIQYLHEASPPIIHGDIKSLNILLGRNLVAKVADFGTSVKIAVRGGHGTPLWMAPELLSLEEEAKTLVYSATPAVDIYSFGITIWEACTQEKPYGAAGEESETYGILKEVKELGRRPAIPKEVPAELRDLIVDCWNQDPEQRPNIRQVRDRLEAIGKNESVMKACPKNADKVLNEKNTNLLHQILSPKVAARLRQGLKAEPEEYDPVTIFFSDIVGYTDLSSGLHPQKLMSMMDRLYTKFDKLCVEGQLFKVETIGDAYMCASGIPELQTDHTRRVALFAMGTVREANATLIDEDKPEMGYINIRVGFHCGPVVASVVGELNPRYCLFGDTVNYASRMESNSVKNRINMSPQANKCLLDQSPGTVTSSRGLMAISGKGDIECFFLDQSEENFMKLAMDSTPMVSIVVHGKEADETITAE